MKQESFVKKKSEQGLGETDDVVISEGNMEHAFQAFINYGNPIGSLLREITSNCFDAHEEAGIDTPPLIKLEKGDLSDSQSKIIFRDYGYGMDYQKIDSVYRQLFESDKRHSNKFIGAKGLGSKSPLSYTDSFIVRSVCNGKLNQFILENAGDSYKIIWIYKEESTNENSGTDVEIPIKDEDINSFIKEAQTQLRYFRNINFEGFSLSDNKVVEGNNWIASSWTHGVSSIDTTTPPRGSMSLHVCFGEVYYPLEEELIEHKVEDTSLFNSPIALKFNIGELRVIWNREKLQYTKETVDKLVERYNECLEELIEIARENKRANNLEEYLKLGHSNSHTLVFPDSNISFYFSGDGMVNRFIEGYNFIKEPNELSLFVKYEIFELKENYKSPEYPTVVSAKASGSLYDNKVFVSFLRSLNNSQKIQVYFSGSENFSSEKNYHLLREHPMSTILLVKRKERDINDLLFCENGDVFSQTVSFFKNHNYDFPNTLPWNQDDYRSEFSSLLKEVDSFVSKYFKDYNAVEISESNKENLKSLKNKREIEDSEVPYREIVGSYALNELFRMNQCYNKPEVFGSSRKYRGTIIYGFQEDRDLLFDAAYVVYSQPRYISKYFVSEITIEENNTIHIVQIAKTREKAIVKHSNNPIHVRKFMNSNHSALVHFMTVNKLYKSIEDYEGHLLTPQTTHLLRNCDDIVEGDDKDQIIRLQKRIETYMENHFANIKTYGNNVNRVYNELVEMFDQYNLWYQPALDDFNKLVEFLYKYPLLEYFDDVDLRVERRKRFSKYSLTEAVNNYMDNVPYKNVNPKYCKILKEMKNERNSSN